MYPFGNDKRDKSHQLRYFISSFSTKVKHVFELGTDVCFDEGGIFTKQRYCPIRMYNKEKTTGFVLIYLSCQIKALFDLYF